MTKDTYAGLQALTWVVVFGRIGIWTLLNSGKSRYETPATRIDSSHVIAAILMLTVLALFLKSSSDLTAMGLAYALAGLILLDISLLLMSP